ncbi:unnamed protein product [Allacma fusca]|uniref:DUF1917 domain-containing protein n=1 Tax=Allacma fusca TaxID=39272 RepID=A0A8J2JIC4_9HEXA|nr:unnamed protein product [Allacma fusca]
MAGNLNPERPVDFPTKNEEDEWIHCQDESGKHLDKVPGDKAGKWLIFAPFRLIDPLWYSVCIATRKGDLGYASKVSTAMGDDEYDWETKVICVYTYDWTDEADVMRVRSALDRMGFTQRLSYKTNADSLAGKYSHRGHKRIAKYYV